MSDKRAEILKNDLAKTEKKLASTIERHAKAVNLYAARITELESELEESRRNESELKDFAEKKSAELVGVKETINALTSERGVWLKKLKRAGLNP